MRRRRNKTTKTTKRKTMRKFDLKHTTTTNSYFVDTTKQVNYYMEQSRSTTRERVQANTLIRTKQKQKNLNLHSNWNHVCVLCVCVSFKVKLRRWDMCGVTWCLHRLAVMRPPPPHTHSLGLIWKFGRLFGVLLAQRLNSQQYHLSIGYRTSQLDMRSPRRCAHITLAAIRSLMTTITTLNNKKREHITIRIRLRQ